MHVRIRSARKTQYPRQHLGADGIAVCPLSSLFSPLFRIADSEYAAHQRRLIRKERADPTAPKRDRSLRFGRIPK
jgi:hypothetical protein